MDPPEPHRYGTTYRSGIPPPPQADRIGTGGLLGGFQVSSQPDSLAARSNNSVTNNHRLHHRRRNRRRHPPISYLSISRPKCRRCDHKIFKTTVCSSTLPPVAQHLTDSPAGSNNPPGGLYWELGGQVGGQEKSCGNARIRRKRTRCVYTIVVHFQSSSFPPPLWWW